MAEAQQAERAVLSLCEGQHRQQLFERHAPAWEPGKGSSCKGGF